MELAGLTRQCLPVALCLTVLILAGCGGGGSNLGEAVPASLAGPVSIPAFSMQVMDASGPAGSRTISTPALTVTAGQTFTLPVSISDRTGIAGFQLTLTFDGQVLNCVSADNGDTVPDSVSRQILLNTASNVPTAKVAVASTHAAGSGPGTLVTFTMRAVSGATRPSSVGLSGRLSDARGAALGTTNTAGVEVSTASALVGDLKGTGQPEVGSAIKILRVVVSLDPPPAAGDLWQWDCNFSGDVGVGDAIKILRCVVALDPWPITPPPPPPTYLAVADWPDDDGTSLKLTFDASIEDTALEPRVTSYDIYAATTATGEGSRMGQVTATRAASYQYRASGLAVNTRYWLWARAVSSGGLSVPSSKVSGVPLDLRPVQPPSALAAVDHPYDTGKVIDLTWARSGDDGVGRKHVAKYDVYRRMANVNQEVALVGTVPANGAATYVWSDTTVPMDLILYEYTLKAAKADGAESSAAGPAQAASENNNVVAFQPPTHFTVADVAGDTGRQLLLTWNRSTSEGDIGPPPPPPTLSFLTPQGGYGGSYEVYRGTSTGTYGSVPTFSVSAAGTHDPMTYVDSGLTTGTRYYYKVRYRRYNQISDFTAEASAIPLG